MDRVDQEIFVLTKMYKIFFQAKKKHQHQKLGMHEYENSAVSETIRIASTEVLSGHHNFRQVKDKFEKESNVLGKIKNRRSVWNSQ
jgi:hypothetical protein